MDTCSMARDKTAPFAGTEMHVLVGHVAGQLPDPVSARSEAAARGLHPQRLAGLEQDLRRPPVSLSRHARNSLRRLRSVHSAENKKLLGVSAWHDSTVSVVSSTSQSVLAKGSVMEAGTLHARCVNSAYSRKIA
jgi:hypothetical protein